MAVLTGGVIANQCGVWEGRILCVLCFSMQAVPSFPVFMLCSTGMRIVVMSAQDIDDLLKWVQRHLPYYVMICFGQYFDFLTGMYTRTIAVV